VAAGLIFDLILKYFLQDFENIKTEITELGFLQNKKENLVYIRNRYYRIW